VDIVRVARYLALHAWNVFFIDRDGAVRPGGLDAAQNVRITIVIRLWVYEESEYHKFFTHVHGLYLSEVGDCVGWCIPLFFNQYRG